MQAQTQEQDPAHAPTAPSPAIAQLLERIEPAVRKLADRDLGGKDLTDACEEENVHLAVRECLRRSPLLRRYTEAGKFRMAAARYHLESGAVEWLPGRPVPPEQAPAPAHAAVPMTMPPHTALSLLQAGHRRFLGDGRPTGDLTAHRREQLTGGQRPVAIVLCCADSRVAPEHIFDAGLGELFVIRVAGNALNDDALASIEYAASQTGAPLLVVMGHSNCGAMAAAAEHPEDQQLSTSMRALLARLEPSVEKARAAGNQGRDLVELAMRGNVLRTLAEARSRSAVLRELEQQGRFVMVPAVYDIASGDVTWLEDRAEPPPAAPMGETAPAHDTAPPAEPEDAHDAEGAVPAQAVHDAAADPIVATPPAPVAPVVAAPDHVPAPAAPPPPAEVAGEFEPLAAALRDPIVLVGACGVVSLLLAALVALMKK
jgi:carbonic anhydrase